MLSTLLALTFSCLPNGDPTAQGLHQRLSTERGRVHLWCRGDVEATETVLFVHGHVLDADAVFAQHALAEQFARSGRAAIFVVPEAPVGPSEPVPFPSLEALLDDVERRSGARLPRHLIVAGHSGAYRTIAGWLQSPLVTRVLLLDAAYGDLEAFAQWLERPEVRLHLLSGSTLPRAEAFLRGLEPGARARVTHERSELGHWDFIADGVTLPRALAQQPRPLTSG